MAATPRLWGAAGPSALVFRERTSRSADRPLFLGRRVRFALFNGADARPTPTGPRGPVHCTSSPISSELGALRQGARCTPSPHHDERARMTSATRWRRSEIANTRRARGSRQFGWRCAVFLRRPSGGQGPFVPGRRARDPRFSSTSCPLTCSVGAASASSRCRGRAGPIWAGVLPNRDDIASDGGPRGAPNARGIRHPATPDTSPQVSSRGGDRSGDHRPAMASARLLQFRVALKQI